MTSAKGGRPTRETHGTQLEPHRLGGYLLALASDTVSIAVMEVVDNLIMLVIPGAMSAGLQTSLFWGSLALSLAIAALAAFPVNRWLIARGRGHAVVHAHHHKGGHESTGHDRHSR